MNSFILAQLNTAPQTQGAEEKEIAPYSPALSMLTTIKQSQGSRAATDMQGTKGG